MGLSCSKKQGNDEADGDTPLIVRLSPFRRRRCPSRTRSSPGAVEGGSNSATLLGTALEALVRHLHRQPAPALAALPPDLSQLLLERLLAAGRLDDACVLRLSGLGLHFHSLPLGACAEPVKPFWLHCLSSPSLEAADLSKTEGISALLASLGPTPRLGRLCLDYCVDLTDAGLALLKGLVSLHDLSLAGCELLTPAGAEHLRGLTNLRRLNLQTCHQLKLTALTGLVRLEQLDAGWCSSLDDGDAAVLRRFTALTRLNLCCTQARLPPALRLQNTMQPCVTNAGLAHLSGLSQLRALNLAGLRVSDDALAAMLGELPHLEALRLERCLLAGDATLAAIGAHAPRLRELWLGYTAVTDGGLRHLGGLTLLEALSLENCAAGDAGLGVLARLTRLRKLDVSDTDATNDSMGAVAALRRLECLNLSFTGVNDAGLRRLRHLTTLRCLNLDSRHFTDTGVLALAQLTRLECLDLFGARISDIGCASLGKLKSLQRLEVCGGGVTDAGVAHLASLSRLQHLSLAQNYRVGNAAVSHLIKLSQLQALNLSQCRVTSNSVVALGCLPQLQTLALYETRVKPFAVDKLLAANPDLLVQGVRLSSRGP